MTIDILVPALGESVTEATVSNWLKAPGDQVAADEPLVELETDKIAVEVVAPGGGTLADIAVAEGENVEVGALLGHIDESGAPATPKPAPEAAPTAPPSAETPAEAAPETAPTLSPAVRKLMEEAGLDAANVQGSGKDGRIVKADVLQALAARDQQKQAAPAVTEAAPKPAAPAAQQMPRTISPDDAARERRVPMSRLRKRVAERLKLAQNTAAMLTTFNEADMSAVIAARVQHRDNFEKKHGIKLGFMSFFVKASIVALQEIPAANAEIDGDDIVYKDYFHIGVAVSAPQGLIVPVVRDADALGFAEIERSIGDLGVRARDNKLTMQDLIGGTFTISNGGIFGSLLSTPILNPPQSAILGMHKIQARPVAIDGKVEIRPMMNLALSYDHRLIDGREAVTFLVRVKECIEDPQRILFDI